MVLSRGRMGSLTVQPAGPWRRAVLPADCRSPLALALVLVLHLMPGAALPAQLGLPPPLVSVPQISGMGLPVGQ